MNKVCKKCGIENGLEFNYCRACGEKLEESTSAVPEEVFTTQGGEQTRQDEREAGADTIWTRERAVPDVVYAGFWKRGAAVIIDSCILFVIGTLVGIAYVGVAGSEEGLNSANLILGILIGWLYSAILESSSKQATYGKQAIGIKVTDMNGNRISFARASGRHFAKIVSSIILGIGYIMAGFTEKKQALHDKMFDCLVVMKK